MKKDFFFLLAVYFVNMEEFLTWSQLLCTAQQQPGQKVDLCKEILKVRYRNTSRILEHPQLKGTHEDH